MSWKVGSSKASTVAGDASAKRAYNIYLQVVAGLGGLLYGIDVGIIGGALPYLEATSGLTTAQLSIIVAAVLLGSVLSTLFAGVLADALGRKPLMVVSGLMFVLSIPVIAFSHGFGALFLGRLLQGASGGLIGVVVPLYLAECLSATNRGKGTGIFQWLLTMGIVAAAGVGIYYSYQVAAVARLGDAAALLSYKDEAWRHIFWVSLPPGVLFFFGSLLVTESPRWLFRRGKEARAQAALLRSRTPRQAGVEMEEMRAAARAAAELRTAGQKVRDSLMRRKYVAPFLLACAILFLNQTTGINSIIGYNTDILLQSGLSDLWAHWGYVLFTMVNFLMTIVGVVLVDRKGRKFLLVLGTSGIIVSVVAVGMLFLRTEARSVDCARQLQPMAAGQQLSFHFDGKLAERLLKAHGPARTAIDGGHASLTIIYSYGGFSASTSTVRSDDPGAPAIEITRASCVPSNRIEAFFKNPFADLGAARVAPLRIDKAMVGQVPHAGFGWLVALCLYMFAAFYALGPGVCAWLALSELMPTRIRSNGMSFALVINQFTSTSIAAVFLPFVGKHGYASIFFLFGGFTVLYLLVAAFLLPETKNKTLEEIEAIFEGRGAR